MSILDELIDQWHSMGMGANLGTGVDQSAIVEFERINKIVLPAQYKCYLAVVNGFRGGEQDENGFRFWPLEELSDLERCGISVRPIKGDVAYFVFADYMDRSWGYAIDCSFGMIYMVGARSNDLEKVADSFFEFIDFYLKDSEKLYPS